MNDLLKRINVVAALLLFCLLAFSLAANAAKDCSLDGTAGLNPVYNQVIVDTASINPGDTLASMGESNTKQIFATINRSDINLVNSATGGCTIGSYARDNPSKCWANMPKSADVIQMKPINRSLGIDPNVYQAQLEQDIVGALGQIQSRMTGVKEVWMSAHHATPYSADRIIRGVLKPPKQGEPYSHDSIFPIQNVVAQYQGAYPFKLVIGSYLWATSETWTCDLFNDDGVHLNDAGNTKAGGMVNDFISNALGNDPGPNPDPDPDPEPNMCLPDPQYPNQQCKTDFRPGFCTCKNPWRKTQL